MTTQALPMQPLNLGFDLQALMDQGKSRGGAKAERLEKDKTAFYRIIPSTDVADRRISQEYYLHWITGANGKKMTVECTYRTERFCPLCAEHKKAEDLHKRLEDQLPKDAAGKPIPSQDPAFNAQLKQVREVADYFNTDRHFVYAALNANNAPVFLKLKKTESDKLVSKIAEAVNDKGFDPTSYTSGVWFKFKKDGQGRDSVSVDFKKVATVINGEQYEKDDRTPLTQEQIDALQNTTPNVRDKRALWVKTYTAKQLADYLKGIPLPDQNTVASAAAPAPVADSALPTQSQAPVSAPAAVQSPAPAAATLPVAAAAVQAPVTESPVAQTAPTPMQTIQTPVAALPVAPVAQLPTAPLETAVQGSPVAGTPVPVNSELQRLRSLMAQAK